MAIKMKSFFAHLFVSFVLSAFMYLLAAFLEWDILWPYTVEWNFTKRGMLLLLFAFKEAVCFEVPILKQLNIFRYFSDYLDPNLNKK